MMNKLFGWLKSNVLGNTIGSILAIIAIYIATVVAAYISDNLQLFLKLSYLVVPWIITVFCVWHAFRLWQYGKWGRSGDLWWLCISLTSAIDLATNSQKPGKELEGQLHKCHYHASALGISEQGVVRGLSGLWDSFIGGYSESAWPEQMRSEVVSQLKGILDYVGRLAEQNQADFNPGPN